MKVKKLIAAALTCAMLGSSLPAMAEETSFFGKIWIAGDSIASDHSDNREGNQRPIVGWGEVIGEYLDEVEVHNEARSGRSSKSYTKESNYKTIMENIGAGDVFFISFGHNDEKADNKKLYTDPAGTSDTEGSFKYYLKEFYIDPALEAGAYPVLISSVTRYELDGEKIAEQKHKAYKTAMEELVDEYKKAGTDIMYIDAQSYTIDLYQQDLEGAAAYHALIGTGDATELDTTHYCEMGARNMAMYILSQCGEKAPYMRKYITNFAVIRGALYEKSKEQDLFDWVVEA